MIFYWWLLAALSGMMKSGGGGAAGGGGALGALGGGGGGGGGATPAPAPPAAPPPPSLDMTPKEPGTLGQFAKGLWGEAKTGLMDQAMSGGDDTRAQPQPQLSARPMPIATGTPPNMARNRPMGRGHYPRRPGARSLMEDISRPKSLDAGYFPHGGRTGTLMELGARPEDLDETGHGEMIVHVKPHEVVSVEPEPGQPLSVDAAPDVGGEPAAQRTATGSAAPPPFQIDFQKDRTPEPSGARGVGAMIGAMFTGGNPMTARNRAMYMHGQEIQGQAREEYYRDVQRRLASGEPISDREWQQIDVGSMSLGGGRFSTPARDDYIEYGQDPNGRYWERRHTETEFGPERLGSKKYVKDPTKSGYRTQVERDREIFGKHRMASIKAKPIQWKAELYEGFLNDPSEYAARFESLRDQAPNAKALTAMENDFIDAYNEFYKDQIKDGKKSKIEHISVGDVPQRTGGGGGGGGGLADFAGLTGDEPQASGVGGPGGAPQASPMQMLADAQAAGAGSSWDAAQVPERSGPPSFYEQMWESQNRGRTAPQSQQPSFQERFDEIAEDYQAGLSSDALNASIRRHNPMAFKSRKEQAAIRKRWRQLPVKVRAMFGSIANWLESEGFGVAGEPARKR